MSDATTAAPWGKNVLVEFEDSIAWVTLNRPEKRNAMSPPLNDEMVGDARCARDRRPLRRRGADGRRQVVLGRDGFARIFSRARRPALRAAIAWPALGLAMAVEASHGLLQADHRHGQRLVLRRRVHAARRLRSRHRRRGGDLRHLRDQLGHHPGRQRHALGGGDDEPARCDVLCHDRRDLRRQARRRRWGSSTRRCRARGCASARAHWRRRSRQEPDSAARGEAGGAARFRAWPGKRPTNT